MTVRLPSPSRRPSLILTVVALIFLVLIPTIGVISMVLFNAGRSLENVSIQQLSETASTVARSTSNELDLVTGLLKNASELDSYRSDDRNTSGSLPGKGYYVTHQAVLKDGIWQVSGPDVEPEVMALIRLAAASRKRQVSNIFFSNNQTRPICVAISMPEAGMRGDVKIVTLIASPGELIEILRERKANAASVILAITDGEGRILARSQKDTEFIGKVVPSWDALKAVGASSGSFRAVTLEGKEFVFTFQLIENTPGWASVAGESAAEFDRRWQQPLYMLVASALFVILLGLTLAIWLTNLALRPIKYLAARARLIAAGRLSQANAIGTTVPRPFIAEFEDLWLSLDAADRVLQNSLNESRQAERVAQQSIANLKRAERLARIGHWSLDLKTGKMHISDMLNELFGPGDNPSVFEVEHLKSRVTPEGFEQLSQAIRNCIETGMPYALEVMHLNTAGDIFPTYVRGQAIRDENGEIVALAGTVQDISERKEQQERIEALANNLPSGAIFRLERDTKNYFSISYLSSGLEKLLGMTVAEVMARPKIIMLAMHTDEALQFFDDLTKANRTGEVLDRTFQIQARSGQWVWLHCRAYLRVFGDGSAIWDGIARDVTAEREATAMLQAAKEAAEAAERAKSDFLATMSHEIRTPMNSVIGMARLALRTDLNPKQRNYLQKINESASVLLHIINDILDFSRIEAGGLMLENIPFALESLLETLSSVTAVRAEEKGVEIAFRVAADMPQTWRGDPLRLGQVLTNLVSNAIKFTEAGEVVVSISPLRNDQGRIEKLLFSVRDTGIGLTEQQVSQLFKPFWQAQSDTSRKYGGTGLGLAISKRLVEMMGGDIWAESQHGAGSTFFFTARLEEAATDNDAPQGEVRKLSSNLLRGYRILIVDDNASAREILSEMVAGFGMEVTAVGSGSEALTLLEAHSAQGTPFEVVLLDWRMPGMDGVETARRIKLHDSLVRMPLMLMVTAYAQESVVKATEELGMHSVLLKPVTQSVMFNTLLDALSPSTAQEESGKSLFSCDPLHTQNFSRLKGKRVLVADDNALNREVATELLQLVGIHVETVVNGREAIRKLEEQDFHAVLMDVHMPEMGGLEAVREIRRHARWAQLPVIALTAQAREEDCRASMKAGMTDHLTKPIDETLLYATLTRLCGDSAANEEAATDAGATEQQQSTEADALRRWRRLRGFLRDFGDAPTALAQLSEKCDLTGIADLVHQIKGSAGYVDAALSLVEPAKEIEHAARRGEKESVFSLIAAFLPMLAACLDDIRHALARHSEATVRVGTMSAQDALRLLAEAIPLVERGEFGARALLDRLFSGLQGTREAVLLQQGLDAFDDLELSAAVDALTRLRAALESGPDQEDVCRQRI